MQNFLSLVYQNGMIPTINKSTRVTRKTATTIDHILSLIVLLKQSLKLPFLKMIYPNIFLLVSWFHRPQHKGKIKQFLFIKEYLTQSIESFKKKLYETDWEETESSKNPDETIQYFYKRLLSHMIIIFLKERLN